MRASLIVLTYNQLKEGTIPCLESILTYTPEDQFELVIVDNASKDGTPEHLRSFAQGRKNVRLILNETNKGYAGGNNDGLRVAAGDCIVLLNNDTLVTPGWLDSLLAPLERDRSIGMICPITNSAGNEQTVALPSLNEENYVEVAGRYTRRNAGHLFDTEKLGFYCVAMRRDVLEKVGLLDEKFGLGMFEDDDYCLRVKNAGYRLVINEGCFIYHKGSLSFKKLESKEYQQIFERNREYYQRKHGQPWLFNDLTLSYYRHMEQEIASLMSSGNPPAEAERIAVRMKGFEYLVQNAREIERKGGSLKAAQGEDLSFRRLFRIFMKEYVKGDKRSRKLFMRKVRRRRKPLQNQEVIEAMGAIRRKEGFRHLLVMADVPDYLGRGRGSKLADALSAAGITVLYLTRNIEMDAVEVTEEVKEHLYLMDQGLLGFLPHLATREEMVQLVSGVRSIETLDPAPSAYVVDLTGGRETELELFSSALRGRKALLLVDPGAELPVGEGQTLAQVTETDLAGKVKDWMTSS
jgi:GT2 family glycosyltransferase